MKLEKEFGTLKKTFNYNFISKYMYIQLAKMKLVQPKCKIIFGAQLNYLYCLYCNVFFSLLLPINFLQLFHILGAPILFSPTICMYVRKS